jgi:hypothetical protein
MNKLSLKYFGNRKITNHDDNDEVLWDKFNVYVMWPTYYKSKTRGIIKNY